MKKLIALAAFCAATSLSAAPFVDTTALKTYAAKSLPRCPGSAMTLEALPQSGPTNFMIYSVEITSSDSTCGTRKYVMYSPTTQQVVIGTIIALPTDNRPVADRVADQATQMLNKQMRATVAPFPLPDGLKSVAMIRDTEFGPFAYHGFVDASERFLIVGMRGNLRTDPAETLRQSLGLQNAMHRGSKTAKTEIIELSDFQCPTCARAHKKLEPMFAANTAKMNFLRLDLPLFEHHEWALSAALGARAIQRVAPAKYWEYADYLFNNQEEISKQKFDTFFKGWIEDHDIAWAPIEKIYASKTERAALLDQVSRAFDAGIISTPTFIINGQIMGFGPDGSFTYDSLKAALGGGSAPAKTTTPKTTAKKSTTKKSSKR